MSTVPGLAGLRLWGSVVAMVTTLEARVALTMLTDPAVGLARSTAERRPEPEDSRATGSHSSRSRQRQAAMESERQAGRPRPHRSRRFRHRKLDASLREFRCSDR